MFKRTLPPLLMIAAALGYQGLRLTAEEPGDLEDARELVVKEALKKMAPSVVQIQTSGGTDIIAAGPRGAQVRKGMGPTTGLIVGSDGYIISSTFNFANKPSSIDVTVPGRDQKFIAKVIATDTTRMVTLLKIEATGLPVPEPSPKKNFKIGQASLALGRTLPSKIDQMPSVTEGIISAVDRIWGKAIQTDAKISPTNYGGPLVDIEGRVQGVLVPASPWAEGETAGIDWYDSGIGFAIPLEDINAILPRLKKGVDLKKGILGIQAQGQDRYSVVPTIAAVAPGSTAAKAGIKPGDVIQEIDGHEVNNMAQVLHLLGGKYEGDKVSIKLLRGGKDEINLKDLVLGGVSGTLSRAFLGILPMRDDPEPSVEIRYVYPKSPADAAGLKVGDRITRIGQAGPGPMQPVAGRDGLANVIGQIAPGTDIRLEVKRKGGNKTDIVTVKLDDTPDVVPAKLPDDASLKKALAPKKPLNGQPPPPPPDKKDDPKKKVETGLIKITNDAKDRGYWLYVPEDYDKNISYAFMIWLHPVGKTKDDDIDDFKDTWEDYCSKNHIIMAGPKSENSTGWVASDADYVAQVARAVMSQYTIDKERVLVHGMGQGGQMGFYLGFHNRELVRGVATTGSVLTSQVKEKAAGRPLSFFIVAGEKDPLAKAIAQGKKKLLDNKYPVILREIKDMGHQYLDLDTLEELVRWIDSLDRI
jgi:S1-C subfamily serine protease/dienelactone hydrolase